MKKRLLAALMAMTLVIPSGNVFAAELGIQEMNVVEMKAEEVEDTEEQQEAAEALPDELMEQQEELTGLLEEQGVRQAEEVEQMTIEMTEGSAPEALQSGNMGRIDSCLIESADSGKVSVQFSVNEGVTLQGSLYLFAVSPYADSLEGYTRRQSQTASRI